jgi:hypothetical protein
MAFPKLCPSSEISGCAAAVLVLEETCGLTAHAALMKQ